jgi:hypothetical protein
VGRLSEVRLAIARSNLNATGATHLRWLPQNPSLNLLYRNALRQLLKKTGSIPDPETKKVSLIPRRFPLA